MLKRIAKVVEAMELVSDILDRAGLDSVREILDYVEDFSLEDLLADGDLMTDENVIDLLEVAQILLSLDTIDAIGEELYDKFAKEAVEEMFDGKLAEVLTFDEEFPFSELVDDISDLLEVAQKLAELGALDFYYGEGGIHVGDAETVGEVIKLIGGLNILDDRLEEIVELAVDAAGLDIDLSKVDWDAIDLESDAELMADAYARFVEEFNQDVIHITMDDIQAIIDAHHLRMWAAAMNSDEDWAWALRSDAEIVLRSSGLSHPLDRLTPRIKISQNSSLVDI